MILKILRQLDESLIQPGKFVFHVEIHYYIMQHLTVGTFAELQNKPVISHCFSKINFNIIPGLSCDLFPSGVQIIFYKCLSFLPPCFMSYTSHCSLFNCRDNLNEGNMLCISLLCSFFQSFFYVIYSIPLLTQTPLVCEK